MGCCESQRHRSSTEIKSKFSDQMVTTAPSSSLSITTPKQNATDINPMFHAQNQTKTDEKLLFEQMVAEKSSIVRPKKNMRKAKEAKHERQSKIIRHLPLKHKKSLEPIIEQRNLDSVVFDLEVGSARKDMSVSEIVDDLFARYDIYQKGFLNRRQFLMLVNNHSKKNLQRQNNMIGIDLDQMGTVIRKEDMFTTSRQRNC